MHDIRRFGRAMAAGSLAAGIVATLLALLVSPAAAKGTALGSAGAGFGLYLMARSASRFASTPPARLTSVIYRGTVGRMGIYALVFVSAYTFDRSTYHGILGAVAGLFLNYVVMIVVGYLTLRGKPSGQTTVR
ncbi:MAG: hypothetical protein K1Y02_03595 [Candidatus Hydrogenedentes bacterium]|nr:hypothetical protein [Candidatus Hydrogenedentota bacterium]